MYLSVCVCVHMYRPMEARIRSWVPWNWSCLMWVLLGPLQEQLVLLVTEPSLLLPHYSVAVGSSQYELLKQSTVFIW